jgi:squalene-associated FAD-dependent desaturase
VDRDAHELARRLMRLAVVGGGWAGLAAAVEATARGHEVTLFEMAPQLGGRARRIESDGLSLDNGQHILIGAYATTLRLMAQVGVDAEHLLWRTPLRLAFPEGGILELPTGTPGIAFTRGVLARAGWRWSDRLALLRMAAGWALRGFQCADRLTVAQLTAGLPARVRADLVDPLCVAALNTPAALASASVFLRVLRDALFAGPGSADLLLPRVDLGALWPDAACAWLIEGGAELQRSRRVEHLQAREGGWLVDGEIFDAVVLAASAVEAARLALPVAPAWAACAGALRHEPITTVILLSKGSRLPQPMLALRASAAAPAQFAFDLGQLRGIDGAIAFVISGASAWVALGTPETERATLAQARATLGASLSEPLTVLRTISEKRATFLCTPGLERPAARIAEGLFAAGDYVAGPYPATIEGAVRSGVAAVRALGTGKSTPRAHAGSTAAVHTP